MIGLSGSNKNTRQTNQLLKIQKDILEAVVIGDNHQLALDELCAAIEKLTIGGVASVTVYDKQSNSLSVRSAPRFSSEAVEQLNQLVPGDSNGSCGTAVYKERSQFVVDTRSDSRWRSLQAFVDQFDVRACWSVPIKNHSNETIGSFALSSFHARKPEKFHHRLLETAAKLAGMILCRESEEGRLWKAANIDCLTGLGNRPALYERLKHAIERCRRHDKQLAVLFIDLDNFKIVNDICGHEIGDKVLKETALAMARSVRKNDSLARLGGDEFVLLVEDFNDLYELAGIAEKLLKSIARINQNNTIEKWLKPTEISASIGFSVYPQDAEHADLLLRKADKAMYQAKAQGKNQFVFFQSALTERVQSKQLLKREIYTAVNQNEIRAYLQPVFDLESRKITGAEVLARWRHPRRGIVAPSEFIRLVEQAGLMLKMTEQVMSEAMSQALQFWDYVDRHFRLSINLSSSQLVEGAAKSLRTVLQKTGFPATHLDIEITESVSNSLSETMCDEIRQLCELGVQVVIDNFGAGETKIARLKSLPISKVKIDRQYIHEIQNKDESNTVAETIIAMAHSLGFSVAATGVENNVQCNFLSQLDCTFAQGYHFSKPIPSAEFKRYLLAS